MNTYYYSSELYHHGILGQKWGLRRFQNEDGSLTAAGREHYGYGPKRQKYEAQKMIYKSAKKDARNANLDAYAYNNRHPISKQTNKNVAKKLNQKQVNAAMYERASKDAKEAMKAAKEEYKNSDEYKKARQETIKKAVIAGAAVAATALAAYGAYKIYSNNKKLNDAKKVGEEYYGRLKSKASDMTWTAMHYGSGEEYSKARENWKGTQTQLTKYRNLSSSSIKDANKRNTAKRKSESLAKVSDYQYNLAQRYDDVKLKYAGGYGKPNGEGAYRLSQYNKYRGKANEYFAKATANSGKSLYYNARSKQKRR